MSAHKKQPSRKWLALTVAVAALVSIAIPAEAAVRTAAINNVTRITYTYAGDSVTAWPGMWKDQIDDPTLVQNVGYAHSGYTSGQVLENVTGHPATSVLVIAVGTNDIKFQVPQATTVANVIAIAKKVNAQHTLIVATPPSDGQDYVTPDGDPVDRRALGVTLNRALIQAAADNGYLYADPFSMVRATTNGYGSNGGVYGTDDGTHPNYATNTKIAVRMALYIKQSAVGSA